MCPSIECPACGCHSYHRGVCENDKCNFAPLDADMPTGHNKAIRYLAGGHSGIRVHTQVRPFPLVRFYSVDREAINDVAQDIGYAGPFWHHTKQDPLDTDRHGFDLVKQFARPLL